MTTRASRRTFLKLSAAAASLGAARFAHAVPPAKRIAIVTDDDSPLVNNDAVRWAIEKLRQAIGPDHLSTRDGPNTRMIRFDGPTIVVAPVTSGLAVFPNLPKFTQPESTALIPGHINGSRAILATGSDIRGITYAILELADRFRNSDLPMLALQLPAPLIENTPNKVRSVSRAFCSEIEDKPWFYDRAFWSNYLDTLATARFNRFALTFGLAYDFPRGVTDDYLHFPYPYLVEVPGYEQVHVEPALQPGERQRNLETLQFIAAETARRGMDFQLGIWTHAYQWTDSPHSSHHIVGLTPETHAQYCHDALALILKACPQIKGITMRIHGESGIPEGSYPFWQKVFDAIPEARTPDGKPRVIEIDMHAKGLNQIMIDMARKTGMPVKAGAKYWAEHLGLGYQQTDIRANEYPKTGVTGTFAVSAGERNFTRYGYGDFYQFPQGAEPGKSIDLLYRVWPGTQRHLLWGDPALAAGYGRAANFCGAAGLELMEPLFFKGREGSGLPGGRDAYADASLAALPPQSNAPSFRSTLPPQSNAPSFRSTLPPQSNAPSFRSAAPESPYFSHSSSQPESTQPHPPADLDTAKFTTTFMLWGRYLYNPDTDPSFYHRYLKQQFGPAGPALETALSASSRILPLVTTAWCPSASNHEFWPEMLTHCSILPYTTRPLFTDNPAPHNVSAISPLDPQLFTTIGQHAENLISGKPDARYNTSEVIAWLEALVATSTKGLATARTAAGSKARTPEFRRAEEDILILNGLGTYYANLFRAALHYSVHGRNGYAPEGLLAFKKARDAWADFSSRARTVYGVDISYGSTLFRRGDWADRLSAIDADIDAFAKYLGVNPSGPHIVDHLVVPPPPPRPKLAAHHTPAESFRPGSALTLSISNPAEVKEATLWYRHVNHGERWLSTPMQRASATHTAAIPPGYTASPYPIQYYFELRTATSATLHPPFNPAWSNQPYYAIHKRA